MKDLYNNIDVEQTIAPITGSDGSAPAAVEIDLQDANAAVILICTGVNGGTLTAENYWKWTLEHADDDGTGSADDYSAVTSSDVQGVTPDDNGVVVTVDADTEDATIHKIGYVGGKRFVKITPAEAGTAPDLPQAVVTIKGALLDSPPIS